MSVAKKIGEHFVWRGLFLVTSFIVNILMARILKAEGSGSFYILVNNLSLIILAAGFSMESAMVYYGAGNQIAHHKMMSLTAIWALATFLVLTPLIYIFFQSSLSWQDSLLLASYPFAFILINNLSGLFQSRHNFKTYNIVLALSNLVFIGILAAVIFQIIPAYLLVSDVYIDSILWFVIYGFFVVTLLQALFIGICFWLSSSVKRFQLPSRSDTKKLLQYSTLAWIANLVFFLVYRIDYWLVDYFQDDKSLGNYIQVSKLAQIFILIPSIIATVIFPATVLANDSQMRANLARASRMLFTFYALGLSVLAATGWFLFPFLYGQSFDEMFVPFIWLIPGILAISMQALIAAWFAGKNLVRYNIFGAFIALTIIVALDLLLIPTMGIKGAAIASSIGYISYFIYQYIIFTKESQLSLTAFMVISKEDIQWTRQLIRRKNP